jgi:alpha,alpha-trehalose phosphorylase
MWELKEVPPENFSLFFFYHLLVIYRYQVIKQADIVLAMFLFGQAFSPEQKIRNFDYYDPRTTGDSSLSSCIQSVVAFEIGYADIAA